VSQNEALPAHEKTLTRLSKDARSLLAAGVDTTGNLLTLLTYHVLDNPEIHARLKGELASAIPDPEHIPSRQVLEQLPLLSAIVK
jgi:cytochrome P450